MCLFWINEQDSVSGIKAGMGAGMRVVGVGKRNPKELLIQAGATFVINDFNDPNLWSQLKHLDPVEIMSK